MLKINKELARKRKIGYMRSAKLSKIMGCSLRENDVKRALYYRAMQHELTMLEASK